MLEPLEKQGRKICGNNLLLSQEFAGKFARNFHEICQDKKEEIQPTSALRDLDTCFFPP